MFSNKIDLPYCLVVFFVVCPRLRPFWSVFGELACFWCSTAKIKTRQHRDFRSNQECPSLEENNSAGKNYPPASIPPHIQSRDVAVPCPFTRFAIPPTDRSLAMLLSLARSASQFRIGFVQTAVTRRGSWEVPLLPGPYSITQFSSPVPRGLDSNESAASGDEKRRFRNCAGN